MAVVASGLVYQEEVRKRVEAFKTLFAQDPHIASIEYRIASDWSGDDSIFVDVMLNLGTPSSVVARISERMDGALLQVLRSEELGMHAYLNFMSRPDNGR